VPSIEAEPRVAAEHHGRAPGAREMKRPSDMTKLAIGIAALLALLSNPGNPSAQSASEVIDRHVAALGGMDALTAIATMRYVRTVLNTQAGVSSEQSRRIFYSKRPFYYRNEDPVSGRISISDGREMWSGLRTALPDSVAWQPAPRMLPSRELDFDRLFGSFIDYGSKGHRVEFKGTTELESVKVNVLRVAWKDGGEWDLYFAEASGLWWGYRSTTESPVMHLTDYRRVGDILIPHRYMMIEELDNGESRIHERIFSDIVLNITLIDSLFTAGKR